MDKPISKDDLVFLWRIQRLISPTDYKANKRMSSILSKLDDFINSPVVEEKIPETSRVNMDPNIKAGYNEAKKDTDYIEFVNKYKPVDINDYEFTDDTMENWDLDDNVTSYEDSLSSDINVNYFNRLENNNLEEEE